jgi:hypothetical protein
MSTFRRPKSRVTDYRPPGDLGRPPLERGNARPGAAAWDDYASRQKAEAVHHDKWLEGLSEATLCAIAKDLGAVFTNNRRDPVERWQMGRKAAVLRKLSQLRGAVR